MYKYGIERCFGETIAKKDYYNFIAKKELEVWDYWKNSNPCGNPDFYQRIDTINGMMYICSIFNLINDYQYKILMNILSYILCLGY